jgi:competence protein ComEA
MKRILPLAGRALALLAVLALLQGGKATGAPPAALVNLNTASTAQLMELPGIGESRARAIVALRQQRGGFKSVDELRDVKGIGEKALEKLRPLVTVKGKHGLPGH